MKYEISIKGNVPDQLAKTAFLFPKATASALNKMAAQVKTKASTLVRQELTASKQSVDRAFELRYASPTRLQSAMVATGRNISLVSIGAKQSSTRYGGGVTVPQTAIESGRFIPHAFIATMGSGRTGVFLRRPSARHKQIGKGRWSPALKIFQVTGPSIPTLIKSPKIWPQLDALIKQKLPALIQHEIEFFGR